MERKRKIGFGSELEKSISPTIGDYFLLHHANGNKINGGKLVKIEDGCYILNPYQEIDYSSGKPHFRLVKKNVPFKMEQVYSVEPTTRKNLEGFCKYQNNQLKESTNSRSSQ